MNWKPGDLLERKTQRLTLRSMAREDVSEQFVAWMADPEVMNGLNLPRQRLTRVQAVRWVLGYDNNRSFCLGIHLNDVGMVGFFTINIDQRNQTAETAVVIGEQEHWGKNLVVEGRSCILDFLFDELSMHKVLGRPNGRNFGSVFNYKALNFECEAVLRQQTLSIKGRKSESGNQHIANSKNLSNGAYRSIFLVTNERFRNHHRNPRQQ